MGAGDAPAPQLERSTLALTEITLVLDERNLPILVAGAKLDMEGHYTVRLIPLGGGKYALEAVGQMGAIADQVQAGAVNRLKEVNE